MAKTRVEPDVQRAGLDKSCCADVVERRRRRIIQQDVQYISHVLLIYRAQVPSTPKWRRRRDWWLMS